MTDWSKRLITYRRLFHRYPETGWQTFFATCFLAEHLEDAGYQVFAGEEIFGDEELIDAPDDAAAEKCEARARTLAKEAGLAKVDDWLRRMKRKSGVIAVLDTGREGPSRAYRFDIDALTVEESADAERLPVREGFCSAYPGIFHACGHDGHAAIGLALAECLAAEREELDGTLIFIFQPAEEGARGAIPMCRCWRWGKVDRLFCCHIGFAPADTLVAGARGFLATSKFDVEFFGKSAHAGLAPERGKNALLAAAEATVAMQELLQDEKEQGLARLNVGVLNGGEARNTIPAYAKIRMETRGDTTERNIRLREGALRCARQAAQKYGVSCTDTLKGECVSVQSDEELTKLVMRAGAAGGFASCVPAADFGASDDATIWMDMVQRQGGQAAYLLFGTEIRGLHHETVFDFSEDVLEKAFRVLRETAKIP